MVELCSDAVAKTLKKNGIGRVFGIPGGETLHIVDAIASKDIDLVITRQENAAAFMALMGARYCGKTGVCLTTIGPGATNVVMGAGTATLDFAPLLVLTGELPASERTHPRKQYVNQNAIFSAVCKASYTLSPSNTMSICEEALKLTTTERPGAVHVALPTDVMSSPVAESIKRRDKENVPPVIPDMEYAKRCLSDAERPLALIGAGVIRANAGESVRNFIHDNSIPALHTWQGTGVVPFQDPFSLHNIGLACNRIPLEAMKEADLIITIGYDEQEFQPLIWNPKGDKEVLHISRNPPQEVPCYHPQEFVGDIRGMMEKLKGIRKPTPNWASSIREEYQRHISLERESVRGVDPVAVVKAMASFITDDVLVSDVGAHMLWLAEYLPCQRENAVMISNGMIPMGIGLPGAMGVKFVDPKRNCIAVTGDAGFMMTAAELRTAVEHDTPVTVMVWNDSALGLIESRHRLSIGELDVYRFKNTDIPRIADSFGAIGMRIERTSEIPAALEEARKNKLPTVIDIPIDYSRNREILA